MFRSINVPFVQCSVQSMFCSINVPFDQCSVRPMFHSTNVPFDQCYSFDESVVSRQIYLVNQVYLKKHTLSAGQTGKTYTKLLVGRYLVIFKCNTGIHLIGNMLPTFFPLETTNPKKKCRTLDYQMSEQLVVIVYFTT